MKTILAILPILFFLYSCEDKIYYNIPKDEKPLLNNGDTICFIDNTNQYIDSFIVKIIDEYEISDKRYYYERITISYHKLKESSSYGIFFIQQGVEITSISFYGYYFPAINKNENVVNLNLNGVNYSSVYIKHYNDFPDTIPKTVYYAHKHGIIKYNFSDTLYYTLKKR